MAMFVEETRRARWRFLLVGLGGVSLVYIFVFVLPMIYMLTVSYGGGNLGIQEPMGSAFSAYTRFWGNDYYRGILYRSLRLGLWSVVGTATLGLPLAYLAVHGSRLSRAVILMAVVSPLFVSTIVRSFGLRMILDELGLERSFLAVVIGSIQVLLPFMVIPLMRGFRDIDPLIVHSAKTLGAGWARIAFRIALPILAPALLAGTVLVVTLSLNIFSLPIVLGRPEEPTVALLVYQLARAHANFTFAAAVAFILLSATLFVLWMQSRLITRGARSSAL